MDYNVTECHTCGLGEDVIWMNIKIHNVTPEQLGQILAVVKPMYDAEVENELKEHEEWMRKHEKTV